jgi:hypothetical protein
MPANHVRRLILVFVLCALGMGMFGVGGSSPSAHAEGGPPEIWLPTLVNEEWRVVQGYFCGTHSEGHEMDLARVHGGTVGATVRAAANGTVHFWTGGSGTLIVSHGNNYYTEYTHLSQTFVRPGARVYQGQEIGRINGYNHLHFSFYHSPSGSYFARRTLPLHFADGYSFPELSGCNQHYGAVVMARENPDTTPPLIEFRSNLEPEQWYCEDQKIEFYVRDDRQPRGFNQAFGSDPGGEQPDFEGQSGYVQLGWAGEGMHTLHVRAWDMSGQQTLATFGPVGYDVTAPTFDLPEKLPEKIHPLAPQVKVSWPAASDGEGSGIAGYHYYMGTSKEGTSEQFATHPAVSFKEIPPGCYVLRVQAVDNACSKSEWVTVQKVLVVDEQGRLPHEACLALEQGTAAAPEPTATAAAPEPTATAAAPEPTATAAAPEPTPASNPGEEQPETETTNAAEETEEAAEAEEAEEAAEPAEEETPTPVVPPFLHPTATPTISPLTKGE